MRGPKLFEGARVALIAPSSPVNGDVEAKLDRAVKTAEKLNLIPVLYPTARASHGYLAGTDEMRAKDINDAFADKDIDGIWCLRGGYGAHRILPCSTIPPYAKTPSSSADTATLPLSISRSASSAASAHII